MIDRQLSAHFWLREFLRSETATRMGLKIETPPEDIIGNLARLCHEVLEPFRVILGAPVTVLSGWRPPWLNTAVGGSVRSDHMVGRAADFVVAGIGNAEVCRRLAATTLPFKQCILEFPPLGWVHVSAPAPGMAAKREIITAVKHDKTTVYLQGIRD